MFDWFKEILCARGNNNWDLKTALTATRSFQKERNPGLSRRFSKQLCGQINLAKLGKPLVGGILKEVHEEFLTKNQYFVWDVVKNMLSNFVYGFMNYCYDSSKYWLELFWTSKIEDLTTYLGKS